MLILFPQLITCFPGGGNQFGIVTEFVLKAYPARGPALAGVLAYSGDELTKVLQVVHVSSSRPRPYTKLDRVPVQEFLDKQGTNSWLVLAFARAPPHFYVCSLFRLRIQRVDSAL